MPKLKFWDAAHNQWVYVCGGDTPGSAVSPSGGLSTPCLTFPLSARICNSTAGQLGFSTPESVFTMDATGLVWPGGHRIEVVSG